MAKWKTKPRVKEADQLVEGKPWPKGVMFDDMTMKMYVITIHGQKTDVVYGDFIVQEPDGVHYYPCQADIWLAGHDPIIEE